MLRDNLVGLIEPMLSSAGANPLALCTARKSHRTIDPHALKIPAPKGRNLTLTENAASPFHAEPRHWGLCSGVVSCIDCGGAASPGCSEEWCLRGHRGGFGDGAGHDGRDGWRRHE